MQLGLLKLNAGIGRSLEREALLQRENAMLSAENSEMAAGERVEVQAEHMGMEPIPPGALHFLAARPSTDALKAAAALRAHCLDGEWERNHSDYAIWCYRDHRKLLRHGNGRIDVIRRERGNLRYCAASTPAAGGTSETGSAATQASTSPSATTQESSGASSPSSGLSGGAGVPASSTSSASTGGGTPPRGSGWPSSSAASERSSGSSSCCSCSRPGARYTSARCTARTCARPPAIQQLTYEMVPAQRGTITDRNGVDLAVSEPAEDISATPYLVKDPLEAAQRLAPLLGQTQATVLSEPERAQRLRLPRAGVPASRPQAVLGADDPRHRGTPVDAPRVSARHARGAGAGHRRHRRQRAQRARVLAQRAACTGARAAARGQRRARPAGVDRRSRTRGSRRRRCR